MPAPLTVDTFRGQGFVSVCALEMDDMGLAGTPSWLRWKNLELLYRVGVRAGDAPSFLTLRSDVSARRLEAVRIEGRSDGWLRRQIHRAALQVWRRSRITSVWS